MFYLVLKFLHVVGACILLGTGAGIAFFMLAAHRTGDVATIAGVARIVVIADFLFTATAAVVQPLTGLGLVRTLGLSLGDGWIALALLLYLATGAFWLPVVVMQMKMRDLAVSALGTGNALPPLYHRLFAWWFACGFPAFAAVMAILWLMLARPAIPGWD